MTEDCGRKRMVLKTGLVIIVQTVATPFPVYESDKFDCYHSDISDMDLVCQKVEKELVKQATGKI